MEEMHFSLFLALSTAKTREIIYKTNIRRLRDGRKKARWGPQDLSDDIVVSFLGFLFTSNILNWILEKLQLPITKGTDNKSSNKKPALSP